MTRELSTYIISLMTNESTNIKLINPARKQMKKNEEEEKEENVKENKGITDPLSDGRHYLNTL